MRNQELINRNLKEYFDPMRKHHINSIALNSGNTLDHELKKCEIAYKLIKNGHTIITEGQLLNGKRPDIVVLDLDIPIAYEIMKSETEASIAQKSENYLGIRIIGVKI